MSGVFVRDWKAGDVVSAADMDELVAAVGMLERVMAGKEGRGVAGGCVQRECDGPVEWPWQVLASPGEAGMELYVMPGRVMVSGCGVWTDEAGVERGGFEYVTLPGNMVRVDGFDAGLDVPQVVYLQLRGEVVARHLTYAEAYPDAELSGDEDGTLAAQYTGLRDARLELVCVPVETVLTPGADVLRVWPLAIYSPGYEQPVTQLLWGDLSALECRGLVDSWGDVVWPSDRSGAAAWGSAAHGAGMATMVEADFSTEREVITGPLLACMDLDGAVEFYLGDRPAGVPDVPGGGGAWDDGGSDVGDDGDLDDDGDGPDVPGDDGDDGWDDDLPDDDDRDPDEDAVPDGKVAVKIGYERGDGFSECTLVRRRGAYYWRLVLDSEFVGSALAGMKVKGQVTLAANGSQKGTIADVKMSLGDSSASASGAKVSASGELLFRGTGGSSGVASRSHAVEYVLQPGAFAVEARTWYLSPRKLATAGSWVKLTRSDGLTSFDVRASEWWKWSVDVARLQAAAANEAQKQMAARAVSDAAVAVSHDSTVTATLTGTLLAATATATLS